MMDFIKISGYKSIKDIHLNLKPINILIGSNGSGKSNFISFFEFLNNLYNQKLTEYIGKKGGEDKLLHKGSGITQEINFETSFQNKQNGYAAKLILESYGFIIENERLIYEGDKGVNISHFSNESNLKKTDNYRAKYVIGFLNSYLKYHFHDTSKTSPFTKMSNIHTDIFYLYEEGQNLAAYLYTISNNNKLIYNRIVKTIQSVAPYFSDFYLNPNDQGHLRLFWKDKYSSSIYGVNDLSDGTTRFIALTTLFMQPNLPATIIIDEPELGLHPFAITKLAGMINSVANKGTQVIIATQSADLVNHFEPDNIITVDQVDGESQFKRLDKKELAEWLDEYSVGDLWQRNIIKGGQPK